MKRSLVALIGLAGMSTLISGCNTANTAQGTVTKAKIVTASSHASVSSKTQYAKIVHEAKTKSTNLVADSLQINASKQADATPTASVVNHAMDDSDLAFQGVVTKVKTIQSDAKHSSWTELTVYVNRVIHGDQKFTKQSILILESGANYDQNNHQIQELGNLGNHASVVGDELVGFVNDNAQEKAADVAVATDADYTFAYDRETKFTLTDGQYMRTGSTTKDDLTANKQVTELMANLTI